MARFEVKLSHDVIFMRWDVLLYQMHVKYKKPSVAEIKREVIPYLNMAIIIFFSLAIVYLNGECCVYDDCIWIIHL